MLGRSKKNQFLCLLWFIGTFISATVIYGQNAGVEARVTSLSGRALISGNGRNKSRLAGGTALAPGDEIDTTGGGRVVIDLSDGSQIVVLPGSRITFGDYRNAASLRELVQITLGRIRVKINHFQGKPNPYRIKSPTASIAVRGTEFLVNVEPLGETRVFVLEGAVEVSSLNNPAKKLVAEPKRGVLVRPDSTIEFFVADALTKEVGEHEKERQSGVSNQKKDKDIDNNSSRTATNVYEQAIEDVIESGEAALPSRFVAFPDAYLDSADNPAYAGAFTNAEGQLNILPSINGAANVNDELRNRFDLTNPRPVDYSLMPAGTIFFPVSGLRTVIGGSIGYVRNGLQSLVANENSLLNTPPYSPGTTGLQTTTGVTSGNLLSGSLILARQFGSRDQTSLGFSVEHLFSSGNLNENITQLNAGGLSSTQQLASHSAISRTRLTFGIKHDFANVRFGAYYRYGTGTGTNSDVFRVINNVPQPTNVSRTQGNSSEIGFRLRGALTRRLFYGVEGNLLLSKTVENFHRPLIVDSTGRDRANRAALGLGLGYVWRPRTIFSFDAAGGYINSRQQRIEDLTGSLLETERQQARFLSFHAAVQTDIWKNLFISTSILSLIQSRITNNTFFPDRFGQTLNLRGVYSTGGRSSDVFTDFYSNYGVGWRFKSNYIFEYILTTDYGQTSPRHIFLLRYNFDFKGK